MSAQTSEQHLSARLYLWRLRVDHPAAVEKAVDAQRGAAREGLSAVFTGVRFLSGVQHHVLLEVSLQAVGLVTVRAGERTLATVTHLQTTAAATSDTIHYYYC